MKPSTRQFVHLPVPGTSGARITFQLGLSLIELMISITIGLLILVALSSLFINQSRARIELDKSNRMVDNGSYALQLLSDDLRLAGYYGEFVPVSGAAPVPVMPAALPDPCSITATDVTNANSPLTAPTGAFVLQLAVQGVDAATPTSTPAFSTACAAIASANSITLKPGSDIVVVRRTSTARPLAQGNAVANVLYLQASLCQFDPVPFRIATNLTLRKLPCTPASANYADLRQFMVDIYFVSTDDKVTGGVGDHIPTLKRMEIDPNTQQFVVTPLVEGIEYMQLDYGLDTSGDGIVDSYVANPALAQWPDVVAVQMHLLARNTESTKGYTDNKTYDLGLAGSVTPNGSDKNYKRHAYNQYIRVVNVAGRRE